MSAVNIAIQQLKQEYINDLSEKIDLLKQLKQSKNYDELRLNYHKLKGSGQLYGMPEVSELAAIMEKLYSQPIPELEERQSLALNILEKIQNAHRNEECYSLATDPSFIVLEKLAN